MSDHLRIDVKDMEHLDKRYSRLVGQSFTGRILTDMRVVDGKAEVQTAKAEFEKGQMISVDAPEWKEVG